MYQLIGKITGFKGLKGEMKIKPLSGFMVERLTKGARVYLKVNDTYQPFFVKHYHENQKVPLLVLNEHEKIELVEQFKNVEIYVDADQALDLPEHVFHQDELIGLPCFQGQVLKGKVVDIKNYPQCDYLVIETEHKHALIPFRDEFIVKMDEDGIEIVEMEGLF